MSEPVNRVSERRERSEAERSAVERVSRVSNAKWSAAERVSGVSDASEQK